MVPSLRVAAQYGSDLRHSGASTGEGGFASGGFQGGWLSGAMADVIGEARKRVADLKAQIEALHAEKNDGTMVDGRGASGAALKGILKKPEIRRVLKGHFGKVYAMHWAVNDGAEHIFGDSPKVLSASQDGKLMICACTRASGSRPC